MTLTPCAELGMVLLQSLPMFFYSFVNFFLIAVRISKFLAMKSLFGDKIRLLKTRPAENNVSYRDKKSMSSLSLSKRCIIIFAGWVSRSLDKIVDRYKFGIYSLPKLTAPLPVRLVPLGFNRHFLPICSYEIANFFARAEENSTQLLASDD